MAESQEVAVMQAAYGQRDLDLKPSEDLTPACYGCGYSGQVLVDGADRD